jgi:hypothetical protein
MECFNAPDAIRLSPPETSMKTISQPHMNSIPLNKTQSLNVGGQAYEKNKKEPHEQTLLIPINTAKEHRINDKRR